MGILNCLVIDAISKKNPFPCEGHVKLHKVSLKKNEKHFIRPVLGIFSKDVKPYTDFV